MGLLDANGVPISLTPDVAEGDFEEIGHDEDAEDGVRKDPPDADATIEITQDFNHGLPQSHIGNLSVSLVSLCLGMGVERIDISVRTRPGKILTTSPHVKINLKSFDSVEELDDQADCDSEG